MSEEITRKEVIWQLKGLLLGELRTTAKERKALEYAISSLETDEAYQLEYERTTKNDLGVDAISRRSVIKEMEKRYAEGDYITKGFINSLPSVTPQEPRKGHWIEHDWKEMRERGYYRCSVCNCGYQRYKKGIRKSDVPYIDGKEYTLRSIDNYCPNCGADMREVVEE